MKTPTLRITALLLGSGFALAACEDDDATGATRGINSLGAEFVAAFSRNRNDEPLDAQSVALQLTPNADPFNPN